MLVKNQIFVNKYLPVQTQRHEINICKGYSFCSNLLKKIPQECH